MTGQRAIKQDGSIQYCLNSGNQAIVVTLLPDHTSGSISSNLQDDDPDAVEFNAAIDGVESLLLSLVCQGIDISQQQFVEAIFSSIEAIGNNCE